MGTNACPSVPSGVRVCPDPASRNCSGGSRLMGFVVRGVCPKNHRGKPWHQSSLHQNLCIFSQPNQDHQFSSVLRAAHRVVCLWHGLVARLHFELRCSVPSNWFNLYHASSAAMRTYITRLSPVPRKNERFVTRAGGTISKVPFPALYMKIISWMSIGLIGVCQLEAKPILQQTPTLLS